MLKGEDEKDSGSKSDGCSFDLKAITEKAADLKLTNAAPIKCTSHPCVLTRVLGLPSPRKSKLILQCYLIFVLCIKFV
jgi:hypothetical protein